MISFFLLIRMVHATGRIAVKSEREICGDCGSRRERFHFSYTCISFVEILWYILHQKKSFHGNSWSEKLSCSCTCSTHPLQSHLCTHIRRLTYLTRQCRHTIVNSFIVLQKMTSEAFQSLLFPFLLHNRAL